MDRSICWSERSSYLSTSERAKAAQLSHTLKGMIVALQNGEHNIATIQQHTPAHRGRKPDYMTVRRRHDLQPPQPDDLTHADRLVMLGAAKLGTTQLIDNLEF